jgi:two-component system, OmpR family, phosphate regulon sensor histidine kinase PhoR
MQIKRYPVFYGFMVLSLVLLAIFIALFLKKTANEAYNALKTTSELALVQAVRAAESDAFKSLIITMGPQEAVAWASKLDSMRNSSSGILHTQREVVVLSAEAKTKHDTLHETRVSHFNSGNGKSVYIKLQSEVSTIRDSVTLLVPDTTQLMATIGQQVAGYFTASGLDIPYSIRQVADTLPRSDQSVNARFNFVPNQRCDLVLGPQYTYILSQIWPQIGFSMLLFYVVSQVFYLFGQYQRRQEQLLAIKNDFIRNMTHELKTPIATVSVAVEALQDFGVLQHPERAKEYLNISKSELSRLSLLVDKVLKMAIFEEKDPLLAFDTFDFRVMLEETLATMRIQFEKHKAEVQVHIQQGNYAFYGDRLHLTNMLYNLMDNALKYSADNPIISVSLEQRNTDLFLRVADNGIGIPSAYQSRIFERFFRVPTGNVHNVKGYGLGLSYVAGVVQQHGGHIQMESAEGVGTTFTIHLQHA